ncbi:dihydroorotate dehydrogenase electron transfer subunit [Aliicoccus persicus]|uniref:Dihydroorotate dehydrogenase B (NAD(+)), electron transfer subunit n=1 Tax=Aliicoccus persicus TaxID=930138 RepID=A0A662Z0S7_9STAP|nr:dihydroorotate dehydrogenase electron transfer subunit [Aliicoccus persicus]SEV80898.1 dihydroorotate dehydrogenase electron transfer subunit [Aliicoccus persicus]
MKHLMRILSVEEIADNIFEMVLSGEITKEMKVSGQFVHIRVSPYTENVLRRPISIANVDADKETLTIIFRAEGDGTTKMSKMQVGDDLDVLTPLGNGYPLEDFNHVLLVGGGIGVPPLHELSKQLNARGVKTTHVLGFNSKKDVFYEDEFNALGDTYITTADGTYGKEGFVTDQIELLETEFDQFYACGPKVMLKVLNDSMDIDGYISLEERMGCGIGVCYACVVPKPDGSYAKICSDGPVFKKGEILL